MSRLSHEFDNIQSGKLIATGNPPISEQINGIKQHLKESEDNSVGSKPTLASPVRAPKSRFCCIAKEYFSEYSGLVDSLYITPRVIIYNNSLRKSLKYGLTINLKNNALYPRYIEYSTDSPTDTTINIADAASHRFLQPDESLELNITIEPKTSKLINRRRHIFIESDHPNIVFQVPIIVLHQIKDASICDTITFPSCIPGNISYFEFIAYNPTKDPAKIKITSSFPGLDINTLNRSIVPIKDYLQVLLKLKTKKLKVLTGSLSVKFCSQQPRPLQFNFTPKLISVHISIGRINFGTVKFERQLKRTVTICNEGAAEVTLEAEFHEHSMGYSESSENDLSGGGEYKDAASVHSALVSNFGRVDDINSNTGSKSEITLTAAKHFRIHAPESLKPFSSEEAMVIFHPLYDLNSPFDDNLDPPYFLRTKLSLCFADKNKCMQSKWLQITGAIGGLEIELYPKIIDFRKIYLGEEHCSFIRALNIDGQLNAQVKFKDFLDPNDAGVVVTPNEGFLLRPCEKKNFHLSLFSKVPTKFNVFLRFKVTNGGHYRFTIKGQGLQVQLRIFPQLVEFGSVPIGVPQKRYMLLMNPLSVPITLQVRPTEDGEEEPLVLNIKDGTELMPITVRDPIRQLQQINNELKNGGYEPTEILMTDTEPEAVSFCSVDTKASVYSLVFEEDVMEPIPTLAQHLITTLKKQKIFDKSETDKRVVQEAMSYFMNNRYFNALVKHSNFVFMDWNAVPGDPKEIYCDNEIIYLRPNTGKSITVLVIPNNVGYFHRSLTVRICPTNFASAEGVEDEPEKTLINSEFLCSKLWFEYNCCIPHIDWVNVISLVQRIIYAGEDYDFDMTFVNNSTVAGFLHFDVIPSEMSFRDGAWKFYIGAQDRVTAKCSVSFRTIGPTKLSGLIRIVGSHRSYPFHIVATVLPTAVHITPNAIRRRLHVLELNKTHVYIDNASPTNTMVLMHLKDETDQYLTKEGCLLAATGQSTYTTLVSQFTDPDTYTNAIYIDLQFNHVLELPLTFIVEGVPILFEPNIKEGLNIGPIFTDSKENFQSNRAHYSEEVRVINRGKRPYRLVITRLKTFAKPLNANKKSLCAAESMKARFDMWPKNLLLNMQSSDFLTMNASAYEECISHTDFRVDVIDQNYPQKVYTMRIAMVATFLDCNLSWSKKQLCFNYQRTHVKNESPYIETCEIVNPHANPVEAVFLKTNGPFRIKEHFEHHFQKDICVRLEPLERKEIFVVLNKAPLKDLACKPLDGRISVFACGRMQKSLSLKVNLLVANVIILQPELLLFSRGQESTHIVEVKNIGCVAAEFKWKRLETKQQFVDEVDDSEEFIADLLSEIMRMVDYQLEDDKEAENSMMKYRKYRCKYVFRTETINIIMDILDEILDNIDLTHKRYLVNLRYKNNNGEEAFDADVKSSQSFVRHTLSEVLDQIKLDSSFESSQVSSEHCFAELSLYFYEKSGHVDPGETKECLLHIPHIKRSYELTATFELDLVGGRSEMLNIKLVNIAEKVKLSKDIYLHIKPWYETCRSQLRVRNITKYPLRLTIGEYMRANTKQKRLINGCAKVIGNEVIKIEAFGTAPIKIETILGFNESFNHIFGICINDSGETSFSVRGHGIMPILSMASLLNEIEQDSIEILEEYLILQEIYYFDIFQTLTEHDEEAQSAPIEEKHESEKAVSISEYDKLVEPSGNTQSERYIEHEFIFFKLFKSYILINNNADLPNAIILKQLLETTKYLKQLNVNSSLYKIHQKVHQTYVNAQKSFDKKMPINLKHFTIQPIPCELHGNILDLGNLKLNTFKRFSFALHFFGPGKLIVGIRTAVKIPGLYIDFKIDEPAGNPFILWAEKCKSPEFFQKKYRNMSERLLDADLDRQIHHAHSFDIDDLEKHQRDITVSNRRIIENYYSGLNLSVYADHKHHFYFAKIYPKQNSNLANADLHIMGLFKPESRYYTAGQHIEDFIYIDLHMGPTLPILLRAILEN